MIQNAGTSLGYSGWLSSAYTSLFCLSLPVGRSASERSSSTLLKLGGFCPGGPQNLCCPLCPRARQLNHAAWSGVTKNHFRQLFVFPPFYVISAFCNQFQWVSQVDECSLSHLKNWVPETQGREGPLSWEFLEYWWFKLSVISPKSATELSCKLPDFQLCFQSIR